MVARRQSRAKMGTRIAQSAKIAGFKFGTDIYLAAGPGHCAALVVAKWLPKAPPHKGGLPVDKDAEQTVVRGTYRHEMGVGQIFKD